MSKENMLVAIHRIQRTVNKQRQAIPPGMVFEAADETEYDELTEGDTPAARPAKESDIALAKEANLKIEIRPKRAMTLREIQVRRAASMQDALVPPVAANAPVKQEGGEQQEGDGEGEEAADAKKSKKKRDLV